MPKNLALEDVLLVAGAIASEVALYALAGWKVALLGFGVALIYLAHQQVR